MSARARRTARAEDAHGRATAPNRWRCKVPGCPEADVWQPAITKGAALAAAAGHYRRLHHDPDWQPPAGYAEDRARFLARRA